ncbi:mitochondrial carrier domain-containing protein [Piptocephalis cylindrospora]|uniref:Mitochondrial carrier domain-containing protein n=1 Tax=Piptocephalis cylindrospora TaxID=1907219 RepID=A0A4P9Y2G8_9FUNG|nr:mitochondrial carrier domain-containing protein [Piptocephalis cylindrospora]|eukprot:RKP12884.1 mitochondrial carrier domain-containing protein [Piptocephalis cylindrospora]
MSAPLPPIGHAIAGSGGALFALCCVYPLDLVKTKLQVQQPSTPNPYKSTTDALVRTAREKGIQGLYAGLPAGMLGVVSTNFAYFYWYELLRGNYRRLLQPVISTPWELALGAGAGALAQLFTIPVSVVITRQQTAGKGEEHQGFVDTWWDIVQEDGWTGLWKGLKPSLLLVVNPAITYGAYERLQNWVLSVTHRTRLSPLQVFLVGALAKAIATIVTYPYIMAKVRLQWKPSREEKATGRAPRYRGALDVLRKVYRHNGFFGLYTGMQAQIGKAVLSQALLMLMKDRLTHWTILLFALFHRMAPSKV